MQIHVLNQTLLRIFEDMAVFFPDIGLALILAFSMKWSTQTIKEYEQHSL